MLDNIDELILSTLSKNSRQDSKEIWDFLMGYGYTLTEEEIGSRMATQYRLTPQRLNAAW
jgi:DNA-binding Lrp family transcriptional regulator